MPAPLPDLGRELHAHLYGLFMPLGLSVCLRCQGECKYTIVDDGHSEWVSCVRFSPSPTAPVIVSCGWDKRVKVRRDHDL